MTQIVLDDETIRKLSGCSGSVQIRDSAGNVVGVFRPNSVRVYDRTQMPAMDLAALKRKPPSAERLTTEELKRRMRSRA
jgi:hypothetical protein